MLKKGKLPEARKRIGIGLVNLANMSYIAIVFGNSLSIESKIPKTIFGIVILFLIYSSAIIVLNERNYASN